MKRSVPVESQLQSHLDEGVGAQATLFDELFAKVVKREHRDLHILHQPETTAVW